MKKIIKNIKLKIKLLKKNVNTLNNNVLFLSKSNNIKLIKKNKKKLIRSYNWRSKNINYNLNSIINNKDDKTKNNISLNYNSWLFWPNHHFPIIKNKIKRSFRNIRILKEKSFYNFKYYKNLKNRLLDKKFNIKRKKHQSVFKKYDNQLTVKKNRISLNKQRKSINIINKNKFNPVLRFYSNFKNILYTQRSILNKKTLVINKTNKLYKIPHKENLRRFILFKNKYNENKVHKIKDNIDLNNKVIGIEFQHLKNKLLSIKFLTTEGSSMVHQINKTIFNKIPICSKLIFDSKIISIISIKTITKLINFSIFFKDNTNYELVNNKVSINNLRYKELKLGQESEIRGLESYYDNSKNLIKLIILIKNKL